MYQTYWQLEYPAGVLRTEPEEGETILHAPRGYTGLRLCDAYGKPLIRMDIGPGQRPIFYRRRSIEMGPKAHKGIHLDATVFGIGWENDKEVAGKLYLWWNGQAVNCPDRAIDQSAIEHLVLSPVGI